ncbi:MAG: bifunctional diaminohydroxyphosphoribosylaminopyrimidine deaminase/5-amino-6-(5-phosphoribosylamino)uracil reductase RibD [Lentisphaerae bacterium]|nr:bifunctional diaminohydroxyphosphoribosylaminopyrimidine deaminase/5-amino-6-(5-phosphoribosylamino)uracil reductase RibD [Lentisphaerota bacterium]
MENFDTACMQEALALAKLGWGHTNPNPMVGAVVVSPDKKIIGRGYHVRAGEAHAEVNAVQDALRHYGSCKNCTIYVTLEPCCTTGRTPPCTQLIIDNGIAKVVTGALDPNPKHAGKGIEILEKAGISCVVGVCQDECIELNRPFFKYISTGKPFVILKMAMTLDGKIANPDGLSKWITGVEARSRVQQLRRLSDAIMVGGGTLKADSPGLTVREPEDWTPQPRRIIVSNSMSDGDVEAYFPDGNVERVAPASTGEWHSLMSRLGQENCMVLLVEGGGELADNVLKSGIVDYVEFHIAPILLGGRDSFPVLGGNHPGTLADALKLHRVKVTSYGSDIAISGYTQE